MDYEMILDVTPAHIAAATGCPRHGLTHVRIRTLKPDGLTNVSCWQCMLLGPTRTTPQDAVAAWNKMIANPLMADEENSPPKKWTPFRTAPGRAYNNGMKGRTKETAS